MSSLPLMLVPGLMCDHAVWEPLLPTLGAGRPCTVVDHGDADSLAQMARQLLAQAPAQCLLAGHSMGARVVLEAWRLAPERIRGVALLSTGYLPRPAGAAGDEEARKRMALLQVAREQGVGAMARQWVQGMVDPARLGDTALIDRIIAMFERKTADVFERQIRALLGRPDASAVLRTIDVPALVLCGRQDAWSPVAQHQALHALIPRADLALIDHAGHMAPMERADEVAAILAGWSLNCDEAEAACPRTA